VFFLHVILGQNMGAFLARVVAPHTAEMLPNCFTEPAALKQQIAILA